MSDKFVYIRNVAEENRIQIKFNFPPENLNSNHELFSYKPRVFNFDRPKHEQLSLTLQRISSSVSKIVNMRKKRKNKSQDTEEMDINVELLNGDLLITDSIKINDVLADDLTLVIYHIGYKIKVNPPTIVSIQLPKLILSKYPIFPTIITEFSKGMDYIIRWYIEQKKNYKDHEKHLNRVKEHLKFDLVSQEQVFIPSDDYIGQYLKVECILNEACLSFISKSVITEGPDLCPFEKRQKYCLPITDSKSFRVISYNILADVYADQDFSKEFLFPYCPDNFLSFDYRRHLLKKEIFGYNSDIFCLQEVDKKFFDLDLLPTANINNFEGLLKLKSGDVMEGSAIFFRKNKFELLSRNDIVIKDLLDETEYTKDIRTAVDKNELLKAMVIERSTILQVAILRFVNFPDRNLMVATTHLYFHPKAAHVRLIQLALIFRHLEHLAQQFKQDEKLMLILCGDLNSSPTTSLHEFILNASLPSTHADWYIGGKPEFAGFTLNHNFDLINACGHPSYTNYVAGFRQCIDYIFVEKDSFKITDVIPMPSHEDVVQFTALPNQVFPSDHLAIGCTLELIE